MRHLFMKKTISLLLSLTSLLCLVPTPVGALIPIPNENGEYEYDEEGNLVISEDSSLSKMRSFRRGGSINLEQEFIDRLGYNPNREWNEGDRPEDVLTFGDLESYGFQRLTLEQLNPDVDVANISLSEVGIIHDLTLRELTRTVPGLGNRVVNEVAPFRDTFPDYLQSVELRLVFNLNAEELGSEFEKKVRQEIKAYVEQKVGENQELVSAGISQGIDLVTLSISEELRANFSESISLDLETVNTNVKTSVRQKLDFAAKRLEGEVTTFLEKSHEQTAMEIEAFISQRLDEYQAEINTAVDTAFEESKAAVGDEIALGGTSVVEELDLGVVEQVFDDYKQLVRDFSNDTIGTLFDEVIGFIHEELERVSNIVDRIPDGLGDLRMKNFDLEKYTVGDIPGLSEIAIEEFKNYKTATFSQVPGAKEYSFSRLPDIKSSYKIEIPDNFDINFGFGMARVDLVLSEAEKFTDRAISGSLRETFYRANCHQSQSLNDGCAHVEVAKVSPFFFNAGKQWVSGDSQEVNGGKNLLEYYGGGKEPTGRLPFYGSRLKMVLRNNDEQTDTTELYLALQICFREVSGVQHCTPHNVLEFPVHTFKTDDLIFLGVTL